MKRFLIILTVCVLLCSALYGCKSNSDKNESTTGDSVSASQSQDGSNGDSVSLAPGEEEDSDRLRNIMRDQNRCFLFFFQDASNVVTDI